MKEITDFVFDEHIFPMDRSVLENKLRSRLVHGFLYGLFKGKESLDKRVNNEIERLNLNYSFIKDFFKEIDKQRYCNAEYIIDRMENGHESHKVVIKGEGSEIFDINGLPSLEMSKDRKLKWTFLPVKKDNVEFGLTIYEHPQIDIPASGQLKLKYSFETSFNLGDSRSLFTKNPLKIAFGMGEDKFSYFYGQPGKVFYRHGNFLSGGDALVDNLNNAIFNRFIPFGGKREEFKMQGKIFLKESGVLLYQGPIESSGTFPFFIKKDS